MPASRDMPDPPTAAAPRLLVTTGPTREPVDAVRYLSNRSSGRMGAAIAEAAAARRWPCTVLLGPVDSAVADGLERAAPTPPRIHRFTTTEDLRSLLHRHWPDADILVMAAAVADHRPHVDDPATLATKLRRGDGEMLLRLTPTPDLLAELAAITRPDQVAIGFALEPPERLHASASEKLRRKRLAGIVANPLATMDAGTIDGRLILADGAVLAPPEADGRRALDKRTFASWLLDRLATLWREASAVTIRSNR